MAEYAFQQIEKKWQKQWKDSKIYEVSNHSNKPKYYILDMFPYPSGAGLHVGHPLGYIASDILARYKRHKGYNVLHPMGYDSFGLPAEQYAIQTGQHPALTTEQNIARYREQLNSIGFCYDWSREVRTSNADYYKWTQWIFKLIYNSWYNTQSDKAEPIETLIAQLDAKGNQHVKAVCDEDTPVISAAAWKAFSEKEKQQFLLKYRLTYLAETTVNWCPALGTVLSNDEVKDGFSERGGHPVVKKKMPQWSMRITAYADRLLKGLDTIDWPEPIKEMQRNWIGKSVGCEVRFSLNPNPSSKEKGVGVRGSEQTTTRGWQTADKNVAHILKKFARENRTGATVQEDKMWQLLRNNQTGFKVRRQHAIETYIADFVFLREKLIIEINGGYHDAPDQKERDKARTEVLNNLGFEVMVVRNEEVEKDPFQVRDKIQRRLEEIRQETGTGDVSKSDEAFLSKSAQATLESQQSEGTPSPSEKEPGVEAFTTRIDTIFGVTFLVLAPEHELVPILTTAEQKAAVETYVAEAINRSERERMSDVKKVTGVFTGSYATNPFTGKQIPIWIADYVLAGYGTGAVMAVPAHDERDHRFATHFGLPIVQVIDGKVDVQQDAFTSKDAKVINSDFLNGLKATDAILKATEYAEANGFGIAKINFRLRDAIFGRQRYWGEPIPIYYKDGVPHLVEDDELPLQLPAINEYLPTEDGDPPLGRAKDWNHDGHPYELSTMPGWAGSSWYFFRYMDPKNDKEFASKEAMDYWQDVDFYLGGSEHATGHLLYARFWTKFLYDRGYVKVEEFAKKLVNQGMIQGNSQFVFRLEWLKSQNDNLPFRMSSIFVSYDLVKTIQEERKNGKSETLIKELESQGFTSESKYAKDGNYPKFGMYHVPINWVDLHGNLDLEIFLKEQQFVESGKADILSSPDKHYKCHSEIEKMSKSKYNVVNPDDLVEKYGADTLRMYEMFLGPIEQSKPWNTNGIEGVFKFLRKYWNLFHTKDTFTISEEAATKPELKILHTLLKKVDQDCESLSLNTSVSAFMIAVNELGALGCNKREILAPMTIALSPFAPHIAEELWHSMGHANSVVDAPFPQWDEKHLVEDNFEYPISINGKMRVKLSFPVDMPPAEIEKAVLADETVLKWTEGQAPKKVIVVPRRIVNVVM